MPDFSPKDIFKNVEKNYKFRRGAVKTPQDAQIFNIAMELCLHYGNIEAARKIVKFCEDQYTALDNGNLDSDNMDTFVKVMIEEKDISEAYSSIIFTNQLEHKETAEKLAILAGQKLDFEQQQKQTLNSLFSSSSHWKML